MFNKLAFKLIELLFLIPFSFISIEKLPNVDEHIDWAAEHMD